LGVPKFFLAKESSWRKKRFPGGETQRRVSSILLRDQGRKGEGGPMFNVIEERGYRDDRRLLLRGKREGAIHSKELNPNISILHPPSYVIHLHQKWEKAISSSKPKRRGEIWIGLATAKEEKRRRSRSPRAEKKKRPDLGERTGRTPSISYWGKRKGREK